MSFEPVREDLAWAAGFFDGEGCITLSHKNDRYMSVAIIIGQKLVDTDWLNESESLVRFKEAVGFGNLGRPFRDKRRQESLYCQYHVGGFEQTQAIISMLWPWLGEAKRDKWRVCRNLYLKHRTDKNIAYPQRKRVLT